jgi:hypothetical protein
LWTWTAGCSDANKRDRKVGRGHPPETTGLSATYSWTQPQPITRRPMPSGSRNALRSISVRTRHPRGHERPVQLGAGAAFSSPHRHCAPLRLSRGGCSCQCGRASVPMIPQFVQTMRGPKDGTGTSSDHGSALRIARWWQIQQHTSSDRTPLARMLPSRLDCTLRCKECRSCGQSCGCGAAEPP